MKKRNEITVRIELSKKGIPCLWECGGGWSNTGEAQIICDRKGNPKKTIFERTRGDLACKEHALIPVKNGDHIIRVDRHRDSYKVTAFVITKILDDVAECKRIRITSNLYDAAEAAKQKTCIYHCRAAVYIRQDPEDSFHV